MLFQLAGSALLHPSADRTALGSAAILVGPEFVEHFAEQLTKDYDLAEFVGGPLLASPQAEAAAFTAVIDVLAAEIRRSARL